MAMQYRRASKTRKNVFLILTVLLSIPIGAAIGFMIGLMATTFIPQCCTDQGCHSCLQWNGLVGYQASGIIGVYVGAFLIPLLSVLFLIHRRTSTS